MVTKCDSFIDFAENHLKARTVGAKFYFGENPLPEVDLPDRPLRYCEAVIRTIESSGPMLLTGERISCNAGKEMLSLTDCKQCKIGECVRELVDAGRFLNELAVVKVMSLVPRLEKRPKAILLSTLGQDVPDVYILFIRPEEFMKVVQSVQRITEDELRFNLSGMTPVCGNCTVRPYVTNQICISFGCNDSRKYGGIEGNELVVGIPREMAHTIMSSFLEMQKIQTSESSMKK